MTDDPPLYQRIVGFAIAAAPVVIAWALVRRRNLAPLDAADSLVLWGLVIIVMEHAWWGRFEFGGAQLGDHTGSTSRCSPRTGSRPTRWWASSWRP